MTNRSATPPTQDKPELAPLDVPTMRESVRPILADGVTPPDAERVATLFLLLRGMIMVLIPEVESAAWKLPKNDIPRACALACVGEARMRLRLGEADDRPLVAWAVVQRLARSVRALADHYENLGGDHS